MSKTNRSTTLKGSGADRDPAKQVFAKSGDAAKKLMAQALSSLREKKRRDFMQAKKSAPENLVR